MTFKKPIQFKRLEEKGLLIKWSDGAEQRLSSEALRRHCPCATCKEARGDTTHSKPLTGNAAPKKSSLTVLSSSLEEETRLVRIWPVGNYALGVEWGDGHSSGIYTYQYLEGLEG